MSKENVAKSAGRETREALHLELVAETLRKFSEVRFIAQGTSMLPTIYPGDCVKVKTFGRETPHCGEAVLCGRGGEFRVHRIVAILEQEPERLYILRGDSLEANDPAVAGSELLGRVVSVKRGGNTFAPDLRMDARGRVLRAVVRRYGLAAALLVRWHERRGARIAKHEEAAANASSMEARAEYR